MTGEEKHRSIVSYATVIISIVLQQWTTWCAKLFVHLHLTPCFIHLRCNMDYKRHIRVNCHMFLVSALDKDANTSLRTGGFTGANIRGVNCGGLRSRTGRFTDDKYYMFIRKWTKTPRSWTLYSSEYTDRNISHRQLQYFFMFVVPYTIKHPKHLEITTNEIKNTEHV
jgi:hypothetical protein